MGAQVRDHALAVGERRSHDADGGPDRGGESCVMDRRPGPIGIFDGRGGAGIDPAADAFVDESCVGCGGLVPGIEAQRKFVVATEIVVGTLAQETGFRWRGTVASDQGGLVTVDLEKVERLEVGATTELRGVLLGGAGPEDEGFWQRMLR